MIITKLWSASIAFSQIFCISPRKAETSFVIQEHEEAPKLEEVIFATDLQISNGIEQSTTYWAGENRYRDPIRWGNWDPWSDDQTQDAESYVEEMRSVEGIPPGYLQLLKEVKNYFGKRVPLEGAGEDLLKQLKVKNVDAVIERHQSKENLFKIRLRSVGQYGFPEVVIQICLIVEDLENDIEIKILLDEHQPSSVSSLKKEELEGMRFNCEKYVEESLVTYESKRRLIDAVIRRYLNKPIDQRFVKNKAGKSVLLIFNNLVPWKMQSRRISAKEYIEMVQLNQEVVPPAYIEILKLANRPQPELSDSSKALINKIGIWHFRSYVLDPSRRNPSLAIAFYIFIEGPRKSKVSMKVENIFDTLETSPVVNVTWGDDIGECYFLTEEERESVRHMTETNLRSMVKTNDSYLMDLVLCKLQVELFYKDHLLIKMPENDEYGRRCENSLRRFVNLLIAYKEMCAGCIEGVRNITPGDRIAVLSTGSPIIPSELQEAFSTKSSFKESV